MELELNKKRIEFDTTGKHFAIGLSWDNKHYQMGGKYVAFIIGCFVIRINF